MSAAASPSDIFNTPARWSDGAAELSFAQTGGETRLQHLYQSDPCRVLFPTKMKGSYKQAVIVTTSGGVVGGDRLRLSLDAGVGTGATVTTQAAEKVYRSAGQDSEIDVSVRVHDGAMTEWMPQETILFQGARLRRRTEIEISGNGRLIAGEIVVFGRRAMDEVFTEGLLHDAWRIRRDETLVWADCLHLEGGIGETIADCHAFDGAAAVATVLYCGDDATDRLDFARSTIQAGAATCVDKVLIARFVDRDAAALRRHVAQYWGNLRQEVASLPTILPRVWDI